VALIVAEVYDALRAINVPEEKARKAAEALAGYEPQLADIRSDLRLLEMDARRHVCRRVVAPAQSLSLGLGGLPCSAPGPRGTNLARCGGIPMRRRLEKHSGYDNAHTRGWHDVGIVQVRRTLNRNTGAMKHEILLRPHPKVSPGHAGAEIMPGGHVRFWGQKAPASTAPRRRLTSRTRF
jgi:hypothetical protein